MIITRTYGIPLLFRISAAKQSNRKSRYSHVRSIRDINTINYSHSCSLSVWMVINVLKFVYWRLVFCVAYVHLFSMNTDLVMVGHHLVIGGGYSWMYFRRIGLYGVAIAMLMVHTFNCYCDWKEFVRGFTWSTILICSLSFDRILIHNSGRNALLHLYTYGGFSPNAMPRAPLCTISTEFFWSWLFLVSDYSRWIGWRHSGSVLENLFRSVENQFESAIRDWFGS